MSPRMLVSHRRSSALWASDMFFPAAGLGLRVLSLFDGAGATGGASIPGYVYVLHDDLVSSCLTSRY